MKKKRSKAETWIEILGLPKNFRMKGIARIDQWHKHSHGWYVQIVWRGKKYTSWFSDSRYRYDAKASLKAAGRWRDATERRIGKPMTRRTLSGIQGAGVKRRGDRFEVFWSKPGGIGRTSVSIRKWGLREAERRARAIRERETKKWLQGR